MDEPQTSSVRYVHLMLCNRVGWEYFWYIKLKFRFKVSTPTIDSLHVWAHSKQLKFRLRDFFFLFFQSLFVLLWVFLAGVSGDSLRKGGPKMQRRIKMVQPTG